MAVTEVSTTGRKRCSPALAIAASSAMPPRRSSLVKSTSRMLFLVSMPTRATKPMIAM
jgi:hypothetical protein